MTYPTPSEPQGRVLPFRRPGSAFNRVPQPPVPDVDQSLNKYERQPDEPDDFPHRMKMNALGLLVTIALILAGLWIADVMAHMRKDQDCVLTGRSNCASINVPPQSR